ncbi:MAG: DsbC family protein [Candidatus Thioglobus sp.]|nr:MAG: DsbC family protein [Candidatus Thioglobus sp.]
MFKKTLIALIILSAASYADEKTDIKNLHTLLGGNIEKTDFKGVYEVVNKNIFVSFASENERYLIVGDIVDLQTGQKILGKGAKKLKKAENKRKQTIINSIKDQDKIIFPAENEKYIINVFTDVDCPFCRKLHAEIEKMNELGITIKYLASPLESLHPNAQNVMEKIWCAKDKVKAMDDYKKYKTVPDSKPCKNPVAEQLAIGQQIGVNGTPAIFLANGANPGGYIPAERLLQKIKSSLEK